MGWSWNIASEISLVSGNSEGCVFGGNQARVFFFFLWDLRQFGGLQVTVGSIEDYRDIKCFKES